MNAIIHTMLLNTEFDAITQYAVRTAVGWAACTFLRYITTGWRKVATKCQRKVHKF